MLAPSVVEASERILEWHQLALFRLEFVTLLFLVCPLLFQPLLPNERVAVVKAWTFHKRAPRHESIRQNGILMLAQLLSLLHAH